MRDDDGRKLDHKMLESLRITAVQHVREGAHPEDVAKTLGLHRKTVYGWLARYRKGGAEALRAKPLPGRPPKLSEQQLRRLYTLIVDGDPRRQQFEVALWTKQVVRALIRREFDVALSIASVGRLFSKLGLTPRPPMSRAGEHDPDALARWKREELPDVRVAAHVAGGTLYFCDDSALCPHGGGDGPDVHMIWAATTKGGFCFALYEGAVTPTAFIDFCRRLQHDSRRPAYVVVHGGAAQRAAETERFVESAEGQLRLFFLPGWAGVSGSGPSATPPAPNGRPAPAGSRTIPGQRRPA